jgi:hypothetical protein
MDGGTWRRYPDDVFQKGDMEAFADMKKFFDGADDG